MPNPCQSNDQPFLAYVQHIDNNSQRIYLQPDSYIPVMHELTEQLESVQSSPHLFNFSAVFSH